MTVIFEHLSRDHVGQLIRDAARANLVNSARRNRRSRRAA
jgi:hypothetical protein